ncbi:hypothetical protein [Terricaulis sp.]|uniref:hypothetical protein n=1 Tax=Terricaulis sp. TaxID=2768686 RepID=UPI003783C86F
MRRSVLGVAVALLVTLLWALSTAPALAQDARPWRSPEGGFTVTLPEMWNTGENDDPDVVLFLRSLGMGPAGPSQIVCVVERTSIPAENGEPMLTRAMLNDLTTPVTQRFVEQTESAPRPQWRVETIDGVAVGAYEIDGRSDRLYERRFARLFLIPNDRVLERYITLCVVRTVQPAQEADYASMRAFLSSFHFATEATAP